MNKEELWKGRKGDVSGGGIAGELIGKMNGTWKRCKR